MTVTNGTMHDHACGGCLWRGKAFVVFVFGRRHAEGGLADLGSVDGKLTPFLDTVFFPFIGEFVTHRDAARSFLSRFFRMAFLLVDGPHALGGELGILDYLQALVAAVIFKALQSVTVSFSFFLQAFLELTPISYGVDATCQNGAGRSLGKQLSIQ